VTDTGGYKVDIPDEAVAEALAAVERREAEAHARQGTPEAPEPQAAPADEPGEAEKAAGEAVGEVEALQEEVRRLQALLDESVARARETQERLREDHDRLLRTAADLDNQRKRAAREKEEQIRYASERLLKSFLPVMDNLERAIAMADGSGTGGPLLDGVKLVVRQFLEVLARHGAEPFTSAGQPFDPALHEAILQQETNAVPDGHVSIEMVKGYRIGDRLLRPASVAVAKAPAAPEPPAEPAVASGAAPVEPAASAEPTAVAPAGPQPPEA